MSPSSPTVKSLSVSHSEDLPPLVILAQLFTENHEADHYRTAIGNSAVWGGDLWTSPSPWCVRGRISFRRINAPLFSVYRKFTTKDDFIRFFSAHNRKTKRVPRRARREERLAHVDTDGQSATSLGCQTLPLRTRFGSSTKEAGRRGISTIN